MRRATAEHRNALAGMATCGRKQAFSLVELVIVIVVIGIVAAIAIPRISRGARGAAAAAARAEAERHGFAAQAARMIAIYGAVRGLAGDPQPSSKTER